MNAEGFRKLALALPGVEESAHGNHPDFRAVGKVFSSLGHPNNDFGMVKLTTEQQAALIEKQPGAFAPCAGAWGLRGATSVHLATVTKTVIIEALAAALQNVTAPKSRK